MSKITLNTLADLNNSNTAIANINNNTGTIQNAFDNTLSRDGTAPNSMDAVLDMNSNEIVNLPQGAMTGNAIEYNQFITGLSALGSGGAASAALVAAVASASSSATASTVAATTSIASASAASSSATIAVAAASSATASAASASSSLTTLLAQGIWNNSNQLSKTANYSVADADDTSTIFLGGSTCFTLTFGAASTYNANFVIKIINTDTTRAKIISLDGTEYFLWPSNSGFIWGDGTNWHYDFPRKWFDNTSGYKFYVSSTLGNDANDGLAAGSGNALFSIQTAIDRLHQYVEPNNLAAAVYLADGTYSVGSGINCNYVFGPSEILIEGNSAAPQNVIITCSAGGTCFNCQEPATFTLDGMTLNTSGNGSTGVLCRQHTTVDISNLIFGAFPLGTQIALENHGSMGMIGPLFITGAAVIFLACNDLSFFSNTTYPIDINAGLTYTTFIESERSSIIVLGGGFTGAGAGAGLTGQRSSCDYNAILDSGATTIPGTVAGTTSAGGIYI